MEIYYSKTGYVKSIIDGVIYKTDVIYLGIYDSKDNYVDVSEKEYSDYCEKQEKV